MAGGRRDVDLVIRAEDKASRFLENITKAINTLTGRTEGADNAVSKLGEGFGKFSTTVKQLDNALKGMTGMDYMGKQVAEAGSALDNMRRKLGETEKEVARLETGMAGAAADVARFTKAVDDNSRALDREKQKLREAQQANRALAADLRNATQERDRLATADQKLSDTIAKQEARLTSAREKVARYAAEMNTAEKPTRRMQTNLDAANAAVARHEERLASLREKQSSGAARTTELTGAIQRMSEGVTKANAAIEQQKTTIAGMEQALTQSRAGAKAAEQSQRDFSRALDRTKTAASQQAGSIDRAEQSYRDIAEVAAKAETSFRELAEAARGPLTEAFRQQQSTVSRINNAYQANRKELASLGAEMGRVGVPTRQMVETYNQLNRVHREIQTTYREEMGNLRLMSTALRQTAQDSSQLAATQRTFAGILSSSAMGLQRVTTSAQQAATANARLSEESARAARNARQTANETRSSGSASQQAAGSVSSLAQAYRALYGESRQAMSMMQRLRGEVLGLISAYAGFQGVINLVDKTVAAYQALEAATSRLSVVNSGDMAQTGRDLDFLRRTSNRLGFEFGALAQEYSKFAVATKDTNLEGDKTRKIFTSVIEAARVNKTSLEDLKGVMVALTQIVSKGSVQMEELRQQLGDRLPGALQIMAAGIGVTVEELVDMTSQGQVSAEALVGFAEELDRRFGPQLAASLLTTSTAVGQFQNAVFQALVTFGNAGVVDSFTKLLRQLAETMADPAFQSFAQRLSAGLGILIDGLTLAVRHFDLLVIAGSAFIGIKLSGVLLNLGMAAITMAGNMQRSQAAIAATSGTVAATTGVIGRATAAWTALRVAVQSMALSTGVGIAVTAIATGIGWWATRTKESTEALEMHRRVVDQVKDAYDRVGGSVEEWRKKVNAITVTELENNLARLEEAYRNLRKEISSAGDSGISRASLWGLASGNSGLRAQADQLSKLASAFEQGMLSATAYRMALDQIAQSNGPGIIKDTAEAMIEASAAAVEQEKAIEDARDALRAKTGTDEEAKEALERLAGAQSEASKEMQDSRAAADAAAKGMQAYRDAIDEVKKLLPQFADELERVKTAMDMRDAIKNLGFDQITPELVGMLRQVEGRNVLGRDVLNQITNAGSGAAAAMSLLRHFEQFRAGAYPDMTYRDGVRVNSGYRAGFGSDTVTLDDGSIAKITKGMTVTREQAERDLMRRVTTEFMPKAIQKVGAERFNSFTSAQQGALTSIAYNYGTIPDRIVEALKTGSNEQIAAAIRSLGNDNNGINRGRRNAEAALFAGGVGEAEAQERAAKAVADKAEKAKEFHETQRLNNEQAQFELSIADQELVKREQAKAIREAELEAKKRGTVLTQEEREWILKNTEAKFREKAAQQDVNKQKQEAKAAEERVNALLAQRAELTRQLAGYEKQGNTEKATETRTKLEEVNTELKEAIANAEAMWGAIGGTAAENALTKLETAKLKANDLSKSARQNIIDWTRVGDLFVNGLVGAFDEFAQAVANGEKVGEAARRAFLKFAADFLIEIGKMILRQTLFNILRGFGGVFANVGVAHSGAVVGGSTGRSRSIDPGIFATAGRMHSGGIVPGLRSNEVPMILEENEEVLSKDSPRNILNGGAAANGAAAGGGGNPGGLRSLRIINTFDAGDVVSAGLSTAPGEEAFINAIRTRRSEVKEILS